MNITDVEKLRLARLCVGLEDLEIVRLLDAAGLTTDPLIEMLIQRLFAAEDRDLADELRRQDHEHDSAIKELDREIESLAEEIENLTEENARLQAIAEKFQGVAVVEPQTHPGKVKAGRGGVYPDFVRERLATGAMPRDKLLELAEREWPGCKKAAGNAVARGLREGWIVLTKTGKLALSR